MNRIMLLLGLNPSGFRAGMKQARDETRGFEKDWKDLKKVFTAGGIATLAIGFLRGLATEAQATRQKLQEMGEPIPQSVRALSALGDAFDGVGKVVSTVVGSAIAGWMQLGDVLGSVINRARGISEAQENMAMASARAADEAEARLAKAREANSPEKIAAAEAQLAKVRRDNAFARATEEEKYQMLMEEGIALAEKVNATGEHSIKGAQLRIELERNNAALLKQQDVLLKQRTATEQAAAEAAKKQLDEKHKAEQEALAKQKKSKEEAARAEEAAAARLVQLAEEKAELEERARKAAEGQAEALRRTQQAYEAIIFGITNGGATSEEIGQASPEELKELLRRNNQKLTLLRQNPGSAFDYGNSLSIVRLQNENARAQRELDARNSLNRDVSNLGVEGARRAFKGDPLLFEKLLAEWVTGRSDTEKQTDLLEKISKQIGGTAENGIPGFAQSISRQLDKGVSLIVSGGG